MELTSADAAAHGVRLHYYRTGGGRPPLVLLHGLADDGLCWTPVAEALAPDFDLILVDLRGHGLSEAPPDGYTLENLAREVAALSRLLELEKPRLLGHSLGALTALVLAGLFPDLPRAIVLEDPPPFWRYTEADLRRERSQPGMTGWITAIKRKTWAGLLADARANDPGWSEAEVRPWIDAKHRCSPEAAALVRPADIVSLDFPRLLPRITCPAWLITADPARGAALSAADAASLKAGVPRLQTIHIENAGHSIRRDQFARYLEAVRAALA